MTLAEISVRRPVFALMMTAALIVMGAFSYKDLGLDLMPKTDVPVVTVQVNLPGASAEEIETQITKRVEEVVNTISGIDELRSTSDQGNSRVTITPNAWSKPQITKVHAAPCHTPEMKKVMNRLR